MNKGSQQEIKVYKCVCLCMFDKVPLNVCVWAFCILSGVCVVLIANGDCQVGYKKMVMTASPLPG